MIRALLFDFDGLLLDTEGPSFAAWADVYRQHGHKLTLEMWSAAIGTLDGFHPFEDLERRLGYPLDRETVNSARRAAEDAAIELEELRDGVQDYLEQAERLGLARAKPQPTLYLEALEHLVVTAEEAVAFEDSPNGITAAKAAGIYCVAVPNATTAALDVTHADLVLPSLAEVPLDELLLRVEQDRAAAR